MILQIDEEHKWNSAKNRFYLLFFVYSESETFAEQKQLFWQI